VKLKFHEGATAELEDALKWYRARSETAEGKLAAAIDATLAKVLAAPKRFLRRPPDHRACRVMGFPYEVIYRHVGDAVIVVAIAHTSRKPGYWKQRM
jgi:plasmid stabilization system protein ParE